VQIRPDQPGPRCFRQYVVFCNFCINFCAFLAIFSRFLQFYNTSCCIPRDVVPRAVVPRAVVFHELLYSTRCCSTSCRSTSWRSTRCRSTSCRSTSCRSTNCRGTKVNSQSPPAPRNLEIILLLYLIAHSYAHAKKHKIADSLHILYPVHMWNLKRIRIHKLRSTTERMPALIFIRKSHL
jgi:hypothetical protein